MPASVLIIEDDHDIRQMLKIVLELASFEVRLAANGQDGLAQLKSGLRPQLIVLDLMMPIMSGWAFREHQLRDPAFAEIPVIVLSGGDASAERRQTLGSVKYLEKPIDLDKLVAHVRTMVGVG